MAAIVALVLVYKLFNPVNSLYFPKCPVKVLTGLDCPGCGSQRAIHYLLNLDVVQAFKMNALLVLAIPYVITNFVFDLVKEPGPKLQKWRKRLFGEKAIYFILIVITVYTVLRNIL